MPARCTSGSYIGNETPRTILVGWQPDVVVVKGDVTRQAFLKTVDMPAAESKGAWNNAALVTGRISGFTATGFTLGADVSVNKIGVTFVWFALQSAANEVATGSYAGNGVDATNIDVGLGAAPILVITMPAHAADCRIRMADYGNAFSPELAGVAGNALSLEALYNSGFTVGTDDDVNGLGKTYYWVAVRAVAGFSTNGTYAGDGTDDRNIAVGGGVVPSVVLLTGCMAAWTGWYKPEFRAAAHLEDKCSQFTQTAFPANNIQTMGAASFQVGTALDVNALAKPYYWIAFAATTSLQRGLADVGAGVDSLSVRRMECTNAVVDTSTALHGPTASTWSHAVVTLPNAIVLIYQEGGGLAYVFSPDMGVTWSAPVTIGRAEFYPSAVADLCTGDIHIVYSKLGDPIIGEGNSVYYRSLVYVGVASPAWELGEEVEFAYGSDGAGYSNAVLTVELGNCADPVIGGYAGKLMCVAQRKTATDRTWSTLVATAAWTLQGAAETPVAIPSSSPDERAAAGQASGRLYVVTNAGGRLALYRSKVVDWGDTAVEFISWDGWGGDNDAYFGLAVDFWNSETIQSGGVTLAAREVAVAYIKNLQIHYREWSLPLDDDETPWMTMNDSIIWTPTNAFYTTISRVGQSYRVSAVVREPTLLNHSVVYADGPLFTAWFTVAVDTLGEAWRCIGAPQYATSCYDWAAAWSQTAIGACKVFVGRCPLLLPFLQCETCAGSDAYILTLRFSETGTGADVPTLVVHSVDAGAGAELSRILLAMDDAGIGTEVAGWARILAEAGAGLEAVGIAIRMAEAGTGVETSTIQLLMSDIGAGLEALTRLITWPIADAGVGLEMEHITIAMLEAGTGVEVPLISISMTDTGAGVEAPTILLNVADDGIADEIINLIFYMVDAGLGLDLLNVGLVSADTATGAESVRIILNITETGAGVEQVSMLIYVTLALLRLMVSRGILRLDIEGPGR